MENQPAGKKALNICLLTYRGNPASGGQGVYIRHLSQALAELGHRVQIISGPPYPELSNQLSLIKMPGLDLYNPDHLFKVKNKGELKKPLNLWEYLSMCTGGFPEPFSFGMRVYDYFRLTRPSFDVIHDNQGLAYGILALRRLGYPLVATIHHPVTVDRRMELQAARSFWRHVGIRRWYSFLRMQTRVARRLPMIVSPSEAAKRDLQKEYGIAADRIEVVMNGIDGSIFHPLPEIRREEGHILTVTSADIPLKGLAYLLYALADLRHRKMRLTIIGELKQGGESERLVNELGLRDRVTVTGRIENRQFAAYYARATMVVIPSLYEGFGLPAAEAMACGVPVITTTGGALPEVVGDAGLTVPPGDAEALKRALIRLFDNPQLRDNLGEAGRQRVGRLFNWRKAAEGTVAVYRKALDANH